MALSLCSICGWGCLCRRHAVPFPMVGRIGGHISFSDLGTKDQDRRGFRFSLPVFSYHIGFTSFVRHSSPDITGEGVSALALHSLTDALEGDMGAQLDFVGHWNQSSFPRIACVVKGWLC